MACGRRRALPLGRPHLTLRALTHTICLQCVNESTVVPYFSVRLCTWQYRPPAGHVGVPIPIHLLGIVLLILLRLPHRDRATLQAPARRRARQG